MPSSGAPFNTSKMHLLCPPKPSTIDALFTLPQCRLAHLGNKLYGFNAYLILSPIQSAAVTSNKICYGFTDIPSFIELRVVYA